MKTGFCRGIGVRRQCGGADMKGSFHPRMEGVFLPGRPCSGEVIGQCGHALVSLHERMRKSILGSRGCLPLPVPRAHCLLVLPLSRG